MARSTTKGFRRTSNLLRDQIRKVGESRGFAVSRVVTHWAEIVGAEVAAVCVPVDVKYGRQGFGATLTVLTTGAQAPMLEMQKERLREKVNAVYGYNAIARMRITQTAAQGFAEAQATFAAAPAPSEPPRLTPADKARAADTASDISDETFRDALERLAGNVYSKPRN